VQKDTCQLLFVDPQQGTRMPAHPHAILVAKPPWHWAYARNLYISNPLPSQKGHSRTMPRLDAEDSITQEAESFAKRVGFLYWP
jgi:hypothetical protein